MLGKFIFKILILLFLSICCGKEKNEDLNWKIDLDNMIKNQIMERGVKDTTVLRAIRKVPRHLFVPEDLQDRAYIDRPLPIGEGQTISQPYIVALMTELLKLNKSDRVLEIGTGSGYQTAVLSYLVKEVYSIEIVKPLAESAKEKLKTLGYANVIVKWGDGYQGWIEHAPFDAIIVTAAPDQIPQALIEQLKPEGRLVIPVGTYFQELKVITKGPKDKIKEENIIPVRFVPMVHPKGDTFDSKP
ncbi:MAG: protein-L-isoaspartate(D-aspartate) O-methyltransferase [Pelagibacterales bacterium]|nr:protein-L-isoaspartate(D-aspartate) O-methyltransferase [Pelagibacterales bacterium]